MSDLEPMVGRARELDILAGALRSVRAGDPRVVIVSGPPGSGKTALLRRFAAGIDGDHVRWVSGAEDEQRLPYGLIDQLLPGAPPAGAEPFGVGGQLLHVLAPTGPSTASVLLVDDAHWADSQSLQALTFAVRRLRTDPVLVVVGTRDPDVLPDALRRSIATGLGSEVRLDALDVAHVGQLAAALGRGPLNERMAASLHEHAAGNPLHLRALLAELDDAVLRDTRGPLPAPRSYAALTLETIRSLPPESHRLVQAAAVLGQRAPLTEVARLAGLDDAKRALQHAMEAGLVDVHTRPGAAVVVFQHALIRSAVYHDDLDAVGRAELHDRAGALTEGRVSLEHRAAAALGPDPVLAAELADLAGGEAGRGDPRSASWHLRMAAALSPDRSRRERFLLDAVELLLTAGELKEAMGVGDAIGSFADTARRRYVEGHMAMLQGRQADAEERLLAAWQPPDVDTDVRALVATALAHLYLFQVRAEESAEWARRALEIAPDPTVAVTARSVLVVAYAQTGRNDDARRVIPDDIPRGALTPPDIEHLLARGILHLWTGRWEPALHDLLQVASRREGWRPLRARIIALGYLADVEYRLGRWDDALAHGELAVSLAEDADQFWLQAFVHGQAAAVPAARGDFDRAASHAAAARAAAAALGDAAGLTYAATAAAQLERARGDPGGVIAALEAVLPLAGLPGVRQPGIFPWRELRVEALIELGRLGEAERALGELETSVASHPQPWLLASCARLHGRLHAATGRTDEALRAFDRAIGSLSASLMPFDLAVVEETAGRLLRRTGERTAGGARLERALGLYRRLGAEPFARRCEQALASSGGAAPLPERSGLDLTPQESAVARLVATGLTNRQIAGELVLSVKTIEYHLSNIFNKLGIDSRTKLAVRYAVEESQRRA